MKVFMVRGSDLGPGRPARVKAVARAARPSIPLHSDAATKIVRALRAGGADIIAGHGPILTPPILTPPGR